MFAHDGTASSNGRCTVPVMMTGAVMCLTERVSRYFILITMPNGYATVDALAGLVEALEQIPQHLHRSITFDQGSEWARWPDLVEAYELDAWFCDPHSP